ncbi:hypothetical protein [Roseimaritima ulvae]|uniref:Uncharacterized protein n=1 Tax=Roseimaritima ulvae TaxID=980254 RepID=A0A5B9QML9_9BACT|nr:hypothetical protein [Roseimaritima ulvae]QEG40184.1 hypothetical protein UC8_21900 [Roseimaritima ulvae]
MRVAIGFLVTLLSLSPVNAQGVRGWRQQECFDKSDFVAIVNAEQAVQVPNTLPIVAKDKSNAATFQQHETKLNVVSVLKGKDRPKSVVLIQLLPRPGYEGMGGFPSTIRIRRKTVNPSVDNKATYLVYLSARDDGKYEPVTGHIDPAQSMRRLVTEVEDMNASILPKPNPSQVLTDPGSPLFLDPNAN